MSIGHGGNDSWAPIGQALADLTNGPDLSCDGDEEGPAELSHIMILAKGELAAGGNFRRRALNSGISILGSQHLPQ